MKKTWHSIKKAIIEANITILVTIPLVLAMIVMIIGAFISGSVFHREPPETFTRSISIFSMLLASLSGAAQIIKKEAPSALGFPFKGRLAVITGWFWLFLCGIGVALVLFSS